MVNYEELVAALRSTESRSKRNLLDSAANAIEALSTTLREYEGSAEHVE